MRLALGLILCVVAGCASSRRMAPWPGVRSILVLPALNVSSRLADVDVLLDTITRPVADKGYYVFPVAVTARFIRANGAETVKGMHELSVQRYGEALRADAVLYMTVADDAKGIAVTYRLVSATTGAELWRARLSTSIKELGKAGERAIGDAKTGLPPGPYHPREAERAGD